jgi:hypothetical protein
LFPDSRERFSLREREVEPDASLALGLEVGAGGTCERGEKEQDRRGARDAPFQRRSPYACT